MSGALYDATYALSQHLAALPKVTTPSRTGHDQTSAFNQTLAQQAGQRPAAGSPVITVVAPMTAAPVAPTPDKVQTEWSRKK